jgi:phosphoglycerol transferase
LKPLNKPVPYRAADLSVFPTWRTTLAADWKLIVIVAIAVFFLASVFVSGLPGGLIPDLSKPYSYEGDGMFHAWMAQRVTEGWLFDNARSGYPFGSNFLDFPGSDSGDHVLIKILGLIGGGWVAGVKLFYLLGFVTCFVATYVTGRAFGLNRSFAVAMGVLYTFVPFHFLRLHHLFYTWYFVAPLFFYLALDIYLTNGPAIQVAVKSSLRKIFLLAIGMVILASFGVYYALFGIIMLACAAVMNAVKSGKLHGAKKAAVLIVAMVFGVFLNIAPNLIGTYKNGPNSEVAQRSFGESEVLGLKMMQLLMPRPDHRIHKLSKVADGYNNGSPLINENNLSPIGVIGAAGFMLALIYLIFAPARTEYDVRLRLLAVVTFVLFLFATIGGLGSLFAMIISPSIRAWNRISIFIGCGALLFFFVSLQLLIQKNAPRLAGHTVAISAVLMLIGLYDQTAPVCEKCNARLEASFDSDKAVVEDIEKALPAGSSVYQLPYISFPEGANLFGLINYQMMAGVLQSKALHWSFGGMRGRPGDLFYRALAKEPMTRQLEVIGKLGFQGIYIDRRGYADHGDAVVQELSQLLKQPPLFESNNKEVAFFKLNNSPRPELALLSPKQVQQEADYFVDALGPRYNGDLASGIDFSRNGSPQFISDAQGFYDVEPWGRWSSQKPVFDFTDPLPQKFTLVLKAMGFGPNSQELTKVLIGDQQYSIQLSAGISEVRLDVDLKGSSAKRITFVPPKPVSPKQLTGSLDERTLSIGFVSMRIIPSN